jgi:hypothetical protein
MEASTRVEEWKLQDFLAQRGVLKVLNSMDVVETKESPVLEHMD